jgi:tRNA (guanine37-N1)-methyltransferase
MLIDVLSLFPGMFQGPLHDSIVKRAIVKGCLQLKITDIRNYSRDKHHTVDDTPYGGGPGMVMRPEPIFAAVEDVCTDREEARVILLSPQGEVFSQHKAEELAQVKHLVLICGHYEGVDERVRQHLVDEVISIGDYVLTGGEIPAMVIIDAVTRLLPGTLGATASLLEDSFTEGLLEYPQYTRPSCFRGYSVPEVLLSGNHEQIRRWRRKQSLKNTLIKRPDLLSGYPWSTEDEILLKEIKAEQD